MHGPSLKSTSGTYRHPVHGRVAPSVTSILAGGGGGLETPATRTGTSLHQAFELQVWGRSVAGIDSSFTQRVEQFLRTYSPTVLATEQTVWGGAVPLEYAGTLDLRCRILDVEVVIDLKTGTSDVPAWAALQVAAYASATEILSEDDAHPVGFAPFGAILHVPHGSTNWELLWVNVEYAREQFEHRLTGAGNRRLDRRSAFRPEHRVLASIRAAATSATPVTPVAVESASQKTRRAALALAEVGDFGPALKMLDRIPDDGTWADAVIDIASELLVQGRTQESVQLVAYRLDRYTSGPALARLLNQAPTQEARSVVQSHLQSVYHRGDLGLIARSGDVAGAFGAAASLAPRQLRARAYSDLLSTCARHHDPTRTPSEFVIEAASRIPDAADRAIALVSTLSRRSWGWLYGHEDQQAVVDLVVETTSGLDDPATRVAVHSELLSHDVLDAPSAQSVVEDILSDTRHADPASRVAALKELLATGVLEGWSVHLVVHEILADAPRLGTGIREEHLSEVLESDFPSTWRDRSAIDFLVQAQAPGWEALSHVDAHLEDLSFEQAAAMLGAFAAGRGYRDALAEWAVENAERLDVPSILRAIADHMGAPPRDAFLAQVARDFAGTSPEDALDLASGIHQSDVRREAIASIGRTVLRKGDTATAMDVAALLHRIPGSSHLVYELGWTASMGLDLGLAVGFAQFIQTPARRADFLRTLADQLRRNTPEELTHDTLDELAEDTLDDLGDASDEPGLIAVIDVSDSRSKYLDFHDEDFAPYLDDLADRLSTVDFLPEDVRRVVADWRQHRSTLDSDR